MRPDIILERGDIEVADEDVGGIAVDAAAEPASHLVEEGKLVGEFGVDLGIGLVAAGRDVEVVNPGQAVAGQRTAIWRASSLPQNWRVWISAKGRRDTYGDAVIAGLAALGDIGVAAFPSSSTAGNWPCGHLVSCRQRTSGCQRLEEAADQADPQPHRIDVPGGNLQLHLQSVYRNWRKGEGRHEKGARSGAGRPAPCAHCAGRGYRRVQTATGHSSGGQWPLQTDAGTAT